MTSLPKPFGPKWIDNAGASAADEPCCICGKNVKRGPRVAHVRINSSTQIVHPKAQINSADDQGWFPIGSDCARKVPKEFIDYIDIVKQG